MANFWNVVNKVIQSAEVLLLVLDARLVDETRHSEIEGKINDLGKPLIYVITKCDLVEKEVLEAHKKKLRNCVFVSSKEYHGMTMLKNKILSYDKGYGVTVGVLGYPNVGKSTLINAVKGKSSASTSIMSGHTKGIQKVRAGDIMFLDTPGVIPEDDDREKHAMIGTVDFTKEKDPDLVVMKLLEQFPGIIENFYAVESHDDFEETIEAIALARNMLIKGGKADMIGASRAILRDWQKGLIK